jgi:hypothetical protein
MTAYNHYAIQLKDGVLGTAIISAGGTVHVAQAGLPDKQTIYSDANGTSLANPMTPTRGFISFYTLSTVASVDLYIQAPGGQFIVLAGVTPSGPNEVAVRTDQRRQLAKIPFSIADSVAATEKDTGFVLPTNSMVLDRLHGAGLLVTTAETAGAKTITAGTLSSQSGGSASGFINGSSTASTGQVTGTNGGLFSTNAPYNSDANAATNISYTLVTASVAAKGFLLLPYVLNN